MKNAGHIFIYRFHLNRKARRERVFAKLMSVAANDETRLSPPPPHLPPPVPTSEAHSDAFLLER